MRGKKNVSLAIVRKPSTRDMQAMLDLMVRNRVNEIMAERRTEEQLIPGFQPRDISYEIQRRQTVFERLKWGLYFEKWGCLICGRKKNASHASGGCCGVCMIRVTGRLARIKRDYDADNPESQIAENIDCLTRRLRSAQEL